MASSSKVYGTVIENLEIIETASEGVCIGRHEGKVVFVPFTVPGDIADVMLVRSKKNYTDAFIRNLKKPGESRIEPMCPHFTLCGGCRWQHMRYDAQLVMKQKQVTDNLQRIGGIEIENIFPITPSPNQFHYRNKLEFTYSDTRWLTDDERHSENIEPRGLGFHLPGRFDKIFKVNRCFLQDDYMNEIRNTAQDVALQQDLTFCNRKEHTGFLRNLMIRNSSAGHWMITVIFGFDDEQLISAYINALKEKLPGVKSWIYIINTKANDSLNDLDFHVFSGPDSFTETMEHLHFSVGPLSFYQVNVPQALAMYGMVRKLADLKGTETVYDLYTGTGTIALFVAPHASKVVGIEYVPTAIEDAKKNAVNNKISNAEFFCGDIAKTLNTSFMAEHGHPDVIITDPPRSGMHPDVVAQILNVAPEKVVYVSCNPATQARDIALMKDQYRLAEIHPFDMFPHTHHVENIALLIRK